jgi:hypothetical protein
MVETTNQKRSPRFSDIPPKIWGNL